MNLSKQNFCIAAILCLVFASGCSKNLMPGEGADADSRFGSNTLEQIDDNFGPVASTSGAEGKTEAGAGRDFGSVDRGMPGDGSTGSFSAEPFAGGDAGGQPGSGRDFGSAAPGMPGDGSTGSFSAEPFAGGDAGGQPGSGRDFGSAAPGMPGDGSTGSFSAEPFAGGDAGGQPGSGREFGSAAPGMPGDGSTGSFSAEPFAGGDAGGQPGSGRDFGSAAPGMPGDGSTGSFSAQPFSGPDGGAPSSDSLSKSASADAQPGIEVVEEGIAGGYEKPGPGPDFGSAEQGMPGDGSTGSYSALPFDSAGEGGLAAESADGDSQPAGEFLREESIDEVGEVAELPRGYEKPGPGPDFGSAEQGMPGDGSTGSFSAETFVEESRVIVPQEQEEARRFLPYRSTDHLQDIFFAFDRYDLDDKSRKNLKKNAEYLKSFTQYKIEIEGHCDERGSNEYNISLGERRAQSAKSYLISLGIDASRIRTISYGEERPFCTESNEICWYQNRRAHFLISE